MEANEPELGWNVRPYLRDGVGRNGSQSICLDRDGNAKTDCSYVQKPRRCCVDLIVIIYVSGLWTRNRSTAKRKEDHQYLVEFFQNGLECADGGTLSEDKTC
jgi:hypothetical protein